MKKIKACLSIMNAHVKVNHAAIAKREAEKEAEFQAESEAGWEHLARKKANKRPRIELDISSVNGYSSEKTSVSKGECIGSFQWQ